MAKLLGTAPNQAPTNADLGDLAYQDGDNAIIGPISIVGGDVVVDTDTLFVDTSTNRVGIGTSAPVSNLHVSGNPANITLRDEDAPLNGYWQLGARGGSGEIAVIDVDPNNVIGNSDFRVSVDGSVHFLISSSGNVGIATTSPTQKLDVNDDSIRVRTAKTPASASDTGTTGQIAWDADYIYVCTATDTWKRVAIATW
jgi:hypothetical protein